jgi:uncharacterized protein (TIGR02145 family)
MYNENSTGYYLDVSTVITFTSFVTGFNNKDIGNAISDALSGLLPASIYYYRVRAYNAYGTSPNSNIITVGTTNPYGPMYNYYAYVAVNFAPTGWHLPTSAEYVTLRNFLDPVNPNYTPNLAGGLMKEAGTTHWNPPNTGATNSSGFTALPTGSRTPTGVFVGNNGSCYLPNSYHFGSSVGVGLLLSNYTDFRITTSSVITIGYGMSVRLMKDSTVLLDGQTSTMTDIDGNVYNTICIGTQEWMAEDFKPVHYNDGTPIPVLADATQWTNDTTGAMCWYNNITP